MQVRGHCVMHLSFTVLLFIWSVNLQARNFITKMGFKLPRQPVFGIKPASLQIVYISGCNSSELSHGADCNTVPCQQIVLT